MVEQFSYGPFATASFFFFMTLLDGGTIEDAKMEVQQKFVSTWKVNQYNCIIYFFLDMHIIKYIFKIYVLT